MSCAGLVCLAMLPAAASAAATEVQRPMERVTMTLPAPRGYSVYVALYPLRDLATLSISQGPRVYGYLRDRHSSVSFAAVDEDEIDGDQIDVTFPGVGHLEGRFVADRPLSRGKAKPFCRGPRPTLEVGHVIGRLGLTGDGYPPLHSSHASASIGHSSVLQCQPGYAKNPPKRSLFAYIGGGGDLTYDNHFEEVLSVDDSSRSRATSFLAEREFEGSTVKANTEEVLPHGEVAIRRVLVEHVAVPTLLPGPPAARQVQVTVRPPAPFAGKGVYHRGSHSVLGNLSVRFPGRTVRIGGKRSKARLAVAE
jgi:hypothetical protein